LRKSEIEKMQKGNKDKELEDHYKKPNIQLTEVLKGEYSEILDREIMKCMIQLPRTEGCNFQIKKLIKYSAQKMEKITHTRHITMK
jgi:hypothetical protein